MAQKKTKLLSLDEIRDRLKDRRLYYVAEKAGLTYMSVLRLSKGEVEPKQLTIDKMRKYFEENP